MPRGGERPSRRGAKEAARKTKKKPCALCRDKIDWVDYKDVALLRKYMSDRGKIRARRVTGNCTQHQRDVAMAIKTARELVLLPYTQRTMTERSGGRARTRAERGGERTAEVGAAADGEEAAAAGATGGAGSPEAATDTGELEGADRGHEVAVAEEAGVSGDGVGAGADSEPQETPGSNGSTTTGAAGNGA
jgi:small subunit ribosomal protein S18